MSIIRVMQIIDSLALGGAERMAINIANELPRDQFESHLCTSRRNGPLADQISPHVKRLALDRSHRFDVRAFYALLTYIRQNRIEIIHAHSSSLFIAVAAKQFEPHLRVIWHVHYGNYAICERRSWLYKLVARQSNWIFVVNQQLVNWACSQLMFPTSKVMYLANFVSYPSDLNDDLVLPGSPEKRIVCVANLRPIKDQDNLVRAMQLVVPQFPDAHLLLVGAENDLNYVQNLRSQILSANLEGNIHILGQRQDISSILKSSAIGVISSKSEGLPLALLEYGMMGLSVISTKVGQCSEVLLDGTLGILVEPQQPDSLARAILQLLKHPEARIEFGTKFHEHVRNAYSTSASVEKLCRVYTSLVGS